MYKYWMYLWVIVLLMFLTDTYISRSGYVASFTFWKQVVFLLLFSMLHDFWLKTRHYLQKNTEESDNNTQIFFPCVPASSLIFISSWTLVPT